MDQQPAEPTSHGRTDPESTGTGRTDSESTHAGRTDSRAAVPQAEPRPGWNASAAPSPPAREAADARQELAEESALEAQAAAATEELRHASAGEPPLSTAAALRRGLGHWIKPSTHASHGVYPGPPATIPVAEERAVHRGSRREAVLIAFDPASLRRTAVLIASVYLGLRLGIWAFGRIDQLLLALLLAWLGAISMEPVIRPLSARGLRRGAAAGLVMLGALAAIIGLLAAFGGAFFSQMADLATAIPGLAQTFVRWLNETFGLTFDPNALANTLNVNTSQVAQIATDLAGGVVGIIGSLASWIFQLAAVALFAFYFAADGPRMRRAIGRLLTASRQRVFVTVWDTTVTKTGGYVVSKLLLALLSTIAHAIAFAALDVPFWLPMALWVGVTSQFLPVIGTYVGIALPVLATVFTNPVDGLAIIIFATLYQLLENYILVPKLSKRTMDIHPAVAFGSVVVGVALFGWIGGLVAIPLTAAFISVFSAYGQRYELIPELEEIEAREESVEQAQPAEEDEHVQPVGEDADPPDAGRGEMPDLQ